MCHFKIHREFIGFRIEIVVEKVSLMLLSWEGHFILVLLRCLKMINICYYLSFSDHRVSTLIHTNHPRSTFMSSVTKQHPSRIEAHHISFAEWRTHGLLKLKAEILKNDRGSYLSNNNVPPGWQIFLSLYSWRTPDLWVVHFRKSLTKITPSIEGTRLTLHPTTSSPSWWPSRSKAGLHSTTILSRETLVEPHISLYLFAHSTQPNRNSIPKDKVVICDWVEKTPDIQSTALHLQSNATSTLSPCCSLHRRSGLIRLQFYYRNSYSHQDLSY